MASQDVPKGQGLCQRAPQNVKGHLIETAFLSQASVRLGYTQTRQGRGAATPIRQVRDALVAIGEPSVMLTLTPLELFRSRNVELPEP